MGGQHPCEGSLAAAYVACYSYVHIHIFCENNKLLNIILTEFFVIWTKL